MKQVSSILFFSLIVTPMTVYAQFAGDVFFDIPSVIGMRGETVNMSISAFSGAKKLGAAHIDITYDPQQLEVLDVKPSTSKEFQNNLVYRDKDGAISIVTLNDNSTTEPFGTIGLVNITFKVLDTAPANIAVIMTNVRSLLDTNNEEFSNQGWDGEIVFQTTVQQRTASLNATPIHLRKSASQISPQSERNMMVSPDSELGKRAIEMRPMGELVVLETDKGPITVYVDTSKVEGR